MEESASKFRIIFPSNGPLSKDWDIPAPDVASEFGQAKRNR